MTFLHRGKKVKWEGGVPSGGLPRVLHKASEAR